MLEVLVGLTGLICLGAAVYVYNVYRDPFHPLIYLTGMFSFIYVYMPALLLKSGELFTFVSEEQAVFSHLIVMASLVALITGCLKGSNSPATTPPADFYIPVDSSRLRAGAYVAGAVGLVAWALTILNVGGLANAYSTGYGGGWSDYGYVRDSAYLLLIALLILLSPQGLQAKGFIWRLAIVVFSAPWVIQGLLGARRGPTFMVTIAVVVSWFMARGKRPPVLGTVVGGALLGMLLLFLVSNRNEIHVGSDFDLKANPKDQILNAAAYNEYIFSAGTITASHQIGEYFWGRRWAAEVLVRPVPRQIWPNKWAAMGVPDSYVGIAGGTVLDIMGWAENPGAAPAIVADLWAEWGWLSIPIMGLIGWYYGIAWKRATMWGGRWISNYVIVVMLSIFFITQTMEAVIFRFIILMSVSLYLWRRARILQ